MSPRPDRSAHPAPSVDDLFAQIADGTLSGVAGHVAALTAALAAAIVATIAGRSPADWPEAGGARAQADTLTRRLRALADADSDAHHHATTLLVRSDAGAADGRDDPGGAERDGELADALHAAAVVPLAIAEAAADVTTLAAWAADRGAPALRPDALTAVCLAEAAAGSAAGLVRANLAVGPDHPLATRAHAAADTARQTRQRARQPLT